MAVSFNSVIFDSVTFGDIYHKFDLAIIIRCLLVVLAYECEVFHYECIVVSIGWLFASRHVKGRFAKSQNNSLQHIAAVSYVRCSDFALCLLVLVSDRPVEIQKHAKAVSNTWGFSTNPLGPQLGMYSWGSFFALLVPVTSSKRFLGIRGNAFRIE